MLYFIILVIIILVVGIILYNSLVSSRNTVKNEWANIDVELQRRFDLIPNLVETVKGYMKQEENVLTEITNLRTSWNSAKTTKEKATLNNNLSNGLKSIFAVAESYPDLKSSASFVELQQELSNAETRIASAREVYNSMVNEYNTKIDTIPTNIVASICNFGKADLFEVENEEVRKNVEVKF